MAGGDGFFEGQAALLVGLVSRPELDGKSVTLRSYDVPSSRWAACLDTSNETIRVKVSNLQQTVFGPCAFPARDQGWLCDVHP